MIAKRGTFKEASPAESYVDFFTCNSRKASGHEGGKCWAVEVCPYLLPKGLANRSAGVILRDRVGETTVVIQAQDGKQWELLRINVDNGMEYFIGGRWVIESDSLILDALEKQLNDLSSKCPPRLQGHLPEAIEYRQWRLKRWGREVNHG